MRDLILWAIVWIAFFAYTCPALQLSRRIWAQVLSALLQWTIFFCCGLGFGSSLKIFI